MSQYARQTRGIPKSPASAVLRASRSAFKPHRSARASNGISGAGVAVLFAGTVLAYSAVKGYTISATIRDLLSGKSTPGAGSTLQPPSSKIPLQHGVAGGGAYGYSGDNSPASNQQIAKMLTAKYGWNTGDQWNSLVILWDGESSWSNTATNPDSGAYGIPQALPQTKMPRAARDAAHGGTSDPTAQIRWGLRYILIRYGSPVNALAFKRSHGWY